MMVTCPLLVGIDPSMEVFAACMTLLACVSQSERKVFYKSVITQC